MSAFANMETLGEFAARTGVPVEEESSGAIEWIVQRLSANQRRALERLNDFCGSATAADLGVATTTLNSLWDFRRGERDCLAPLMLMTPEFCEYERCRFWTITAFGKRVCAALAAGTQRAETTEELAQSEGCQSGGDSRNAQTFQQTTRESPPPNKRGDSNQ